jgi:tripartite-type tricarboxylate transporter receptor subunit TctC
MTRFRTILRLALTSLLASAACCSLALADPIADFYTGRTITISIGADPGGTYDLYARTIARYLGKYIPGSPKVIAEDMPGAGGFTGAMHVFSVAPQDGTAIGAIGSSALPYQPLVNPNSPKLDVPHINWLGSVSTYSVLMVVRSETPVYSVDDLRKHETVMATIAPAQLNSVIVAATNAALGTKIRGINGNVGMADSMLAVERGEIDGYPTMPVDVMKRKYANLLAAGKLRVLLQYGPAPSPDYPDVPYAVNLATNSADRMLLDLAQGPMKVGYAYMLGPNVPRDRIAALRAAFAATFKDPDFLADAQRQILTVAPLDGEAVQTLLAQAYQSPPDVVARMRELFRRLLQ